MNLEGLDCWDDYPMEHGCICGNDCEPPRPPLGLGAGAVSIPTRPAAYWRPLVSLSEVWTLMRDGRWHYNITGDYIAAEHVPEGLILLGETKEHA